ncbi:CMRF35-like molecule 6 isoform X5 [Ambystoma mexicanum]|uniref:CMRF35-like molecule 6 isoform X5 n=1 Tax=Ambystoma mexicanum TaxID=8296 RepID=UPI0037E7970F
MLAVLLLLLCSVMGTCELQRTVRSTTGSDVTIHCPYKPKYEKNAKYLNKGPHFISSTDVIKTNQPSATNGRFSLVVDYPKSSFHVTIRNVTMNDSGTYYCGVDKPHQRDEYSVVGLSITEVYGNGTSYTEEVGSTPMVSTDNTDGKMAASEPGDPHWQLSTANSTSAPLSPTDTTVTQTPSLQSGVGNSMIMTAAMVTVILMVVILVSTCIYWRNRNQSRKGRNSGPSPRSEKEAPETNKSSQACNVPLYSTFCSVPTQNAEPSDGKTIYSLLTPLETKTEPSITYAELQFMDNQPTKPCALNSREQDTDYEVISP